MWMPFSGPPASFIFDCLLFQVSQCLTDSGFHIVGLRKTDQRPFGWVNSDFCFVAMLLDRKDDLSLKLVPQNFADFCQAGFDLFAVAGSDLVLPAGVLDVHSGLEVKSE